SSSLGLRGHLSLKLGLFLTERLNLGLDHPLIALQIAFFGRKRVYFGLHLPRVILGGLSHGNAHLAVLDAERGHIVIELFFRRGFLGVELGHCLIERGLLFGQFLLCVLVLGVELGLLALGARDHKQCLV